MLIKQTGKMILIQRGAIIKTPVGVIKVVKIHMHKEENLWRERLRRKIKMEALSKVPICRLWRVPPSRVS